MLAGGRRRRRSTVARWAMLLLALGGLLAMHGLASHGVGGPAVVAPPMSAGLHAAHADLGPTPGVARGTDEMTGPGHGDEVPGGHGGHDGILAGICLAILGAVLLVGVTARRARLLVGLGHESVDVVRMRAIALLARARGPSPPDLRLLSIQRC